MPLYDYRCSRCGIDFEVRQSFSDNRLTVCPSEGGPASCVSPGEGPVQKIFTGVGISFKGDGFYKNDHGANAKSLRKERELVSAKASSSESSDNSSSQSSSSGKDKSSSVSSTASKADSAKKKSKAKASPTTSPH